MNTLSKIKLVAKYFLFTFFILGIFATILSDEEETITSMVLLFILALLFLPSISDFLKEKFSFWRNRAVRYLVYAILFIVGMLSMENTKNTKFYSQQNEIKSE